MSNSITDATPENFDAVVLKSDKPVLVDFWAPWCGPCKQISPVLESMATEHADTFSVVKVNMDDYPELGAKYQVRSLPTITLFKDGHPSATKIGAQPKSAIEAFVLNNI